MHEPNMTKFPAPESHLGFIKHAWDDPKLDLTFQRLVDDHPFNSKVSVLLPGTTSCPQKIENLLTSDTEYYLIEDLPLSEFCKPMFLQSFLHSGKVYAVPSDERLDLDNVAALTPDGWLILILDKFTYHELPLNGRLSAHILRRPKERYVVKVNLKDNFTPGTPYYRKVVNAFKNVPLKFNFWITWVPDETEVCPSSIAKYFYEEGYEAEEQQTQISSTFMPVADVPILVDEREDIDSDRVEAELEDILEWIGCMSLGIRLSSEGTSECDVTNPRPNRSIQNITTIHSSGFFVPCLVRHLIEELRSVLQESSEESVPWLSMTVYGHVDSPVTWGLTENSYNVNGDNFFTLVIMRTEVWCYKISGPRKPFRFFSKCNNLK